MNTPNYDDPGDGFWKKLFKYAVRMGYDLCVLAVTLYFTLLDPHTPAWARAVITAALGYVIMPFDAIPDMALIVGYTDDAALLLGASATVAAHVTDEHRAKAREVVKGWFGDGAA